MPQQIPPLSPGEWEIMKVIWSLRREASVRDVSDAIGEQRDWSYSTIRTMMDRLVEKGYLRAEKLATMNVYFSLVPRHRALVQAIGGFVDQVFDGSAGPLVLQLLKQKKLSEEERQEILRLLEEEREK